MSSEGDAMRDVGFRTLELIYCARYLAENKPLSRAYSELGIVSLTPLELQQVAALAKAIGAR